MNNFDWMNGSDGECGRLLILMMHLMEMLVKEWCVVNSMGPIGAIILFIGKQSI